MMNIFNQQEPVVRPATQAGRFYDGNPQRLSHEVDSFWRFMPRMRSMKMWQP